MNKKLSLLVFLYAYLYISILNKVKQASNYKLLILIRTLKLI